ncbi:MAG: VCBS repeat-containing protein [Acidobacteria bacterium]|nr:VCBS repeat-containing protein [Acidobacteriota bacterium]
MKKIKLTTTRLFIILLFCVSITIQTSAAPGDLDPSFGSGGRVTSTDFGGNAIAIQSDGKIVVAGTLFSSNGGFGRFAMVRYQGRTESSFTVTRSDDRNNATCVSGDCSLREAVNAANASATDDTINFASGLTTITLTNEIIINNAGTLTINGTGADVLTIDGGAGTNRIFYTNRATVTISGVTLTGGNGIGGGGVYSGIGGAVFVQGGFLTLDGVQVTGNSVNRSGGGVAFGGGDSGPVLPGTNRIINSNISGNNAAANGGGIWANAPLTIVNSTISGNRATVLAGGYDNEGPEAIVVNSTISGNTASYGGGFLTYVGYATLRNVTITNNTAQRGGGIYQVSDYDYEENPPRPYPATLNLGNTIVAGNTATTGIAPEIYIQFAISIITSAGGNLVGDSPGDSTNTGDVAIAYQPTDIRDTNPMLGALVNNGGLTRTHALLAGSPAIDRGINALVSPLASVFDQRGTGFARIRDGNGDGTATVDIGAFEVQSSATASRPTPFDFDGDGKADVSVFRPANGAWYLQQSANGFSGVQFGFGTDKLTPADYDGDGKSDIAVYRSGIWYLQRSQLGFLGFAFGSGEDVPQPADFDGDGRAEIAVWRPSNGTWYVFNLATNQFISFQFGAGTDKPIVGDYDGDGLADYAVFRPSNGTWYIQRSTAGYKEIQFGNSSDKLVPADYDGDGKTDVAVFRPSEGNWYVQRSASGSLQVVSWGLASDSPVPADYDGDGKADIAVYRDGIWYIRQSTSGINSTYFGSSGDVPTNQVQ